MAAYQLDLPGLAQRWDEGDEVWVGDELPIDTWNYEIADLGGDGSDTIARTFIKRHHYSHKYVVARRRFALYHRTGELRGVAVFSEPMQPKVTSPYFPDAPALPDGGKSTAELGRLVLLDKVRKNGETWFVGECFRRLKREGFSGVVSFSDPKIRPRLDGSSVTPGHCGIIYQGLGAHFAGRSTPRIVRLFPDGTEPNPRGMTKIRKLETGWPVQVEDLTRAAAALGRDLERFDPRWNRQRRSAWVQAALAAATRRFPHPGNWRYVWGFTEAYRKALPPNPREYPVPPGGRVPPRFGRRAEALRKAA
jgi:hypothetical protein